MLWGADCVKTNNSVDV